MDEEFAARLAKVDEIRARGDDPGASTDDVVRIAGRVLLKRPQGRLTFAKVRDGTGELQLFVSQGELGKDEFARFGEEIERGDWVGVEGKVMKTKLGELSVNVTSFQLLSKALRPLPEKWHGLSDTDTRYRQRYVDLIANDDARRVFDIRFAAISAMRRFLTERGYVEVETPTTTRSTSTSRCASRPSCISSVSSWAATTACSSSRGCFATKVCRRGTTPSSRCSSCTRPSPITTT